MKLFNGGAYLVNGTDIVADSPEAGALLQQKTGHTVTKEDAKNMSLDTLKEICKSVSIPVVAIGGINENNLPELKETGIAGAAVVSGIYGQSDIRKACEHLRSLAEGVVLERV